MHTHIHRHTCTYTHADTHTHKCAYTYIDTHIHDHPHPHTIIPPHIHKHAQTHTYTHVHFQMNNMWPKVLYTSGSFLCSDLIYISDNYLLLFVDLGIADSWSLSKSPLYVMLEYNCSNTISFYSGKLLRSSINWLFVMFEFI